ncbi:hypothetical protein DWB61_09940 [Ancylomarina euxinus]|uniref:Cytochrome c domain-containing protein n=1 Tax=Ancylomarina euxinus TaxID=2283627 RepID=A0A425Y1K5_9BACT|nr:Ig-like domain-containing protein [Ancylomarina euxinus]MCZ4693752.1 Ig-like domain-containing protein [Ancylomarina euxinus]MUP15168.1 hypothetical protein [Ancylomarina euxinus]RRG21590.1 hypothetical protein DWB61_09940 [Ancylomarina euxinus]
MSDIYHKSLNKGIQIFKSLSKLFVMAILLLVFGCQKEEDTSAPFSVVSTNITDGAAQVDVFSEITVLFSEDIDASSVDENSFVVNKGQYSVYGKLTCSGSTAIFKPAKQLADEKQYNCTLTVAVKSKSGQSIAQDYHWSFTSGVEPDLIAPTVNENIPADSEIWVFTDSKIQVSFDEAMDAESITSSSFVVKNGDTEVAGSLTYADKTVIFTPDAELNTGLVYTCIVTSDVKDLAGNALAEDFEWRFTTIPGELKFSEMIQPIFTDQSCISCHGGTQNPDLREAYAYASLVDGNYVNIASPNDSRIIKQLKGRHAGFITQKEENLILEWIKQGAKDN